MDLIDEMMAMGPVRYDTPSENPANCPECKHVWHGLTCTVSETRYYELEDGTTDKSDEPCGCPSRFQK